MKTHTFTFFLRGPDVLTDEAQDALYEAGCSDAVFGARDGAQYAAFDRQADSFGAALLSAWRNVVSAIPGVQVVRVEPDEWVTLAAIGERAGLSREAVRLYQTGQRGPGGFPPPIAYADHKTRLWHWPEVAGWLCEHRKAKAELDTDAVELVAGFNAALDLAQHASAFRESESRDLIAEASGGIVMIGAPLAKSRQRV